MATIPKSRLKQLSTQDENVAYLVDQDQAGRQYRENLIKNADVDSSMIFFVSDTENTDVTVEDWIDDEVYASSVQKYLDRYHPNPPKLLLKNFRGDGKVYMLKDFETDEFRFSKTELAYIVLEHAETAPDFQIYNKRYKEYLLKLTKKIHSSFRA